MTGWTVSEDGGVGSFRPLVYLVVCVVGACCRQGFVFGGVVLEFGKCWVVVSIARGLYGTKRESRRVWVCVHTCMFYRVAGACLPLLVVCEAFLRVFCFAGCFYFDFVEFE